MSRFCPHLLLLASITVGLSAQAPSNTSAIPNQALTTTSEPAAIDLQQHFTFTGTTGSIARFQTVMGDFDVELLNSVAPKNVENFTKYANDGESTTEDVKDSDGNVTGTVRVVRNYNNSFIHRASSLERDSTTGIPIINDPEKPVKIIQGGQFKIDGTVRRGITAKDAVELEYNQPNIRGTLAAARGDAANSATSSWFFNVADNTTALGQTNGQGGYTVFGKVLGTGMEVIDAIAALKQYRYSDGFNEFPLRNYTSGPVTDDKLVVFTSVRVVPIQPAADGTEPGVLRYVATSSASNVVEPRIVGRTLTLTPRSPGTATVTVNAHAARGDPATTSFTVTVAAGGPVITSSPVSRTVAPGGTATFTATATGATPLTYQWRKGETPIDGATSATLTLANVSAADAGDYRVAVTNAIGTALSRSATLTVAHPDVGRVVNMSARAGGEQLIVGFVTQGTVNVLVRSVGPTLADHHVSGVMADPRLTLLPGDVSNNDWASSARTELEAAFAKVGAFPLPAESKDAALLATVSGANSAIAVPASGSGGIVLTELYDLRESGGRFINVSARTRVGTGDSVLIAGFVINGNVPKRVLIRAVGPSLAAFGLSNLLANPKLELYRGNTLIAENDDWSSDPEVVNGPALGFPLESGSLDAALVLTLTPGAYSAIVRGVNDSTGEALIEVYETD